MQNALKEIISSIPKNNIFDSHFIIATLIKDYSDTYLNFADGIASNKSKTLTVHGKIGQEIAKLENASLIKRLSETSFSLNIHGKASECTAWQKI